jgi:hypothetical protein
LSEDRDVSDLPRIPRSPSGRIPQWVLDEAVGWKVDPAPWRGPVSPLQPAWQRPVRPRRRSTLYALLLVLALSIGGTLAVGYFNGRFGPAIAGAVPGNRNAPPPGQEESSSPLGTPPPVPALPVGAGYRFLATAPGAEDPVTWSPCRPIHYVVRAANEPAYGSELLQEALAVTSGATGLHFVSDGPTTEGPSRERQPYQPGLYGDRWAPVLIAWATVAEVADFAGDAAGEAGPARIRTSTGDDTYMSGTVYLDPAKFSQALAGYGPARARALILHELGHLVGLAHVADQNAIMFPRLNPAVTAYSPGDQAGLAALGRGPCEPDV